MQESPPKNAAVISSVAMPLPEGSQRQQRLSKASISFDDDPIADPSLQRATQAPQTTTAQSKSVFEEHPDLIRLELPSCFEFYPFKELGAFPIRGKHQAKFALAAKNKSTRLAVEAISSLLSSGVSAMDLTIPDFYWVQYKLRLECFGKVPLHVRAICSEPQHVLDVSEGKVSRDTLVNVEVVNKTSLKEDLLDVNAFRAFLDSSREERRFLTDNGLDFAVPCMRDTVELEEKYASSDAYSEIEFLADHAACIQNITTPLSLEERIGLVGNFSPDELNVLNEFRDFVQSYGVQETFVTRCKGCGGEIKTSVSISPRDFL